MRELLKKMISTGIFASLLMSAAVLHGAVFYEDFQAYDVENPSDFSTNGVPLGSWVPSSTAANATRMFDTVNYGWTCLWISNVDGSYITSAGIAVESNTQYRLSVNMILETSSAAATGTGAYDILLGTDAASAVSLVGGPVELPVYGDDKFVADTYNDQITTVLFDVGDVATGEMIFLVFKRVTATAWFGVDNVVINKTKPSAKLKYSYDMLEQPGPQDLDGNGGKDFWLSGQIPVNGGGFAVMTSTNEQQYFRTDFSVLDSIWRNKFLSGKDYTVEFRVNVRTNADEGVSGTFAHKAHRIPFNDGFELVVKQDGFSPSSIGVGEDNRGWHTYRIACSDAGAQVWRDGLPINGKLTAMGGANGSYSYFGNYWRPNLGGEFYIDYYRLDPTGAYAPASAPVRETRLHWGLDYISGLVADQNGGIVDDDSGTDNDGMKHWNNPEYSGDIPAAGLLRDCKGIGALNFETTGHSSVQTVGNNFIFLDEMESVGGLTMEVWANQTSTAGGDAMIMTMQDTFTIASQNGKYKVVVNSFGNDGPEYAISEADKNSAGWTHFAAIIKDFTATGEAGTNYSATVELWIDGELKDSTAIDYAPQIDLVRPVELGSSHVSSSGVYNWDGYIYEPRITLGVLDPSEFTYVKKWGTIILIQ